MIQWQPFCYKAIYALFYEILRHPCHTCIYYSRRVLNTFQDTWRCEHTGKSGMLAGCTPRTRTAWMVKSDCLDVPWHLGHLLPIFALSKIMFTQQLMGITYRKVYLFHNYLPLFCALQSILEPTGNFRSEGLVQCLMGLLRVADRQCSSENGQNLAIQVYWFTLVAITFFFLFLFFTARPCYKHHKFLLTFHICALLLLINCCTRTELLHRCRSRSAVLLQEIIWFCDTADNCHEMDHLFVVIPNISSVHVQNIVEIILWHI